MLLTVPEIGSDIVVAATRTAGVLALNGSVPLFGVGARRDAGGGGAGLVDHQVDRHGVAPVALRVLGVDRDDVRALARPATVAAGIVASRLATGAAWLTVIGLPLHRARACR